MFLYYSSFCICVRCKSRKLTWGDYGKKINTKKIRHSIYKWLR
ncbi:hypothetical protein TcasGA2_TC032804 [Tribolium castaneum]|uniref:Uncharacterized protein n=1 Tax=Tribolium castaneum TaxID=7070 RepID=A0A139WJ20_TRICA|nr:hypothetical protein TcasGA2_TC032804 [Tribolium castaneum]